MLPLKNMINEAYSLDIGRKIKAQARQAMKDGDYIAHGLHTATGKTRRTVINC